MYVTRRQLLQLAAALTATGGAAACSRSGAEVPPQGGPTTVQATAEVLASEGRASSMATSFAPTLAPGATAQGGATWGAQPKPRVLVMVALRGGNDGLSTVVPYSQSAYYDVRKELAYRAEDVLRLDDNYGFNPAMKGLAGKWTEGKLAILHGVGYQNPDRSHFRSMDIWDSASPGEPLMSGWLGRWADTLAQHNPVALLNLNKDLPLSGVGEESAAASVVQHGVVGRTLMQPTLDAIVAASAGDTSSMKEVREAVRHTMSVSGMLEDPYQAVLDRRAAQRKADAEAEARGETPPDRPLGLLDRQLEQVAEFVRAGVPSGAYLCSLGGFDTHVSARGTHERLWTEVDRAVTTFLQNTADASSEPVVVLYSEFGRRVPVNSAKGSDHGAASVVMAVGPSVVGGHYGEPPSLTDLADGDLRSTVDFRQVYHELVIDTLYADPKRVLGSDGHVPLGFLGGV